MKNELADSITASSFTLVAALVEGLEIALKLTVLWHAARILGGM